MGKQKKHVKPLKKGENILKWKCGNWDKQKDGLFICIDNKAEINIKPRKITMLGVCQEETEC